MALTATATRATFEVVKERLSLIDPVVVGVSPNRPNIFLSVVPAIKLESLAENICSALKKERIHYPKTVVFCRSYQDCMNLYLAIIEQLDKDKIEPPGYPNFLEYRLVTMFTRASTSHMKKMVLSLFRNTKSLLRVLIATTAFSMGIDMPDIHQIFHYGTPCDVEQYLQEIGRAGRDEKESRAVLINSKGYHHVQPQMKRYCENKDSCRRKELFKSFIMYEHAEVRKCTCCDICALSCFCEKCKLL